MKEKILTVVFGVGILGYAGVAFSGPYEEWLDYKNRTSPGYESSKKSEGRANFTAALSKITEKGYDRLMERLQVRAKSSEIARLKAFITQLDPNSNGKFDRLSPDKKETVIKIVRTILAIKNSNESYTQAGAMIRGSGSGWWATGTARQCEAEAKAIAEKCAGKSGEEYGKCQNRYFKHHHGDEFCRRPHEMCDFITVRRGFNDAAKEYLTASGYMPTSEEIPPAE